MGAGMGAFAVEAANAKGDDFGSTAARGAPKGDAEGGAGIPVACAVFAPKLNDDDGEDNSFTGCC